MSALAMPWPQTEVRQWFGDLAQASASAESFEAESWRSYRVEEFFAVGLRRQNQSVRPSKSCGESIETIAIFGDFNWE